MNQDKLLTKRISHISKITQHHMDEVLKPYKLSSSTYPFLLALWKDEGINLEKVSRKINVDKALSTRNIHKLIELGYLEKLTNRKDCRACRLFLTKNGKDLVPVIKNELNLWINRITLDLSEQETNLLNSLLEKILIRAEKTEI